LIIVEVASLLGTRLISTQCQDLVIRGHTIRDRHGAIILVQLMATISHIVLDTPSHVSKPNREIMSPASQEKSRARCRLLSTRFMAAERVLGHIVCSPGGMTTRLGRKFSRCINPPWAFRTRLPAIASLPALDRDYLIALISGTNSSDGWLFTVHFSRAWDQFTLKCTP
jgi:hypothetical protein